MKFTDGYWVMRRGVTPHWPAQVEMVQAEADSITLYAATKALNHRGDTLDTALLTIRLSSPMPNVVRVQVMHHAGAADRGPAFELKPQPPAAVQISDTPEALALTSGQLTARIAKTAPDGSPAAWRLEFLDGERLITHSGWRAMGYFDTPDGPTMLDQLGLSVGECVYGLGERFTPFVKNGQSVDMWNEDGGTSSELAYKNIPFYLTNRGYGVFVNHPERVSFEVASEKVARVQFSVPGEKLDYFLIYGPSPKEVLSCYTALTGRPALPPDWSFGLWLTTSFTTSYDENTVTGFIQGMADRDLPLHVFHFDCFWMKQFQWCDFEWDHEVFPDPEGMLQRLKARGLRICVWINPYIAQRSKLFKEGMEQGYLVKRPDGSVWQWDRWQAGMGLVDFTNPAARRWYGEKLRALIEMGVDCFKTDFGERIPTDVVYFDGSDPVKMHNYYSYLYNQTVFDVLEEALGKGRATVFARSATTGGQQFPVHWGGDSTASFESMAESLRGGLSLCLSGFGFWSHDMGGFEQTASADVYKRWCAFGLLSSHSRLHGSSTYRVPWLYDDEAVDVLRFFTRLKCRLMPYLFDAAAQAHDSGIPTMRAMVLEFPDDPACASLDRQYMLGDALLVAPVFSADGSVDSYVPSGRWTHLLTGEVIEGGRWVRKTFDYLSLPLLVRPNTILALGAHDERPDYTYTDGVTFHIFELEDGATAEAHVRASDGSIALTMSASRTGQILTVNIKGQAHDWRVLLRGVAGVSALAGGTAATDPLGTLIKPAAGGTQLSITL